MKTQWEYIAMYKEEVAALIQQQLAELQNNKTVPNQSINEILKSRLVLYTTHLSEAYLSQPIAARA